MGMFDYLTSEYPLPARDAQELEYQTKSCACDMDRLTILTDGSLVALRYGDSEPKPYEFTGEIYFYHYHFKPDWLVDFSAYFYRGRLRELHLMNDTRTIEHFPQP